MLMHVESTITIHAPLERTFAVASDLSLWPRILPHYRYITYLEQSENRNIVRMAARRGWIPIQWTSEQRIDPANHEIHFRHLKAFTKGMHVVWTFSLKGDGVVVTIAHELAPTIPLIGKFIADRVIGGFFISYIAPRTLFHMKQFLEGDNER